MPRAASLALPLASQADHPRKNSHRNNPSQSSSLSVVLCISLHPRSFRSQVSSRHTRLGQRVYRAALIVRYLSKARQTGNLQIQIAHCCRCLCYFFQVAGTCSRDRLVIRLSNLSLLFRTCYLNSIVYRESSAWHLEHPPTPNPRSTAEFGQTNSMAPTPPNATASAPSQRARDDLNQT